MPALGLFFLAPMCAEYLIGYDSNVGQPLVLLGGLLILGPLYGAPALIIREVARRTGRGWPAILLLATAFGVIQAGLVDQSLFNPSYRDIDSWEEDRASTFIPGLGFSAHMAVNFIGGHVIWSIAAPIAAVEALVPRRATTPWLGYAGLAIAGVLYLGASWFIFADHVRTQAFIAPAPQLIAAGAVALLLIVAAFLIRPRSAPPKTRKAPPVWVVGLASVVLFGGYGMLPQDWLGVAGSVAILVIVAIGLAWLSRQQDWGMSHCLAVASGPLLSYAAVAFLVAPLDNPPLVNKLGHNIFFALFIPLLLILGFRAQRLGGRIDGHRLDETFRGEVHRTAGEDEPRAEHLRP